MILLSCGRKNYKRNFEEINPVQIKNINIILISIILIGIIMPHNE
jgi:hypothetical protein